MTTSALEGSDGAGTWAILELLGRHVYGGRVAEVTIAGAPFLRLDVPETPGFEASTHFYAGASLYGLHPTTEALARRQAQMSRPQPIHPWAVREVPRLAPPRTTAPPVHLEDDDDGPGDIDDGDVDGGAELFGDDGE